MDQMKQRNFRLLNFSPVENENFTVFGVWLRFWAFPTSWVLKEHFIASAELNLLIAFAKQKENRKIKCETMNKTFEIERRNPNFRIAATFLSEFRCIELNRQELVRVFLLFYFFDTFQRVAIRLTSILLTPMRPKRSNTRWTLLIITTKYSLHSKAEWPFHSIPLDHLTMFSSSEAVINTWCARIQMSHIHLHRKIPSNRCFLSVQKW